MHSPFAINTAIELTQYRIEDETIHHDDFTMFSNRRGNTWRLELPGETITFNSSREAAEYLVNLYL